MFRHLFVMVLLAFVAGCSNKPPENPQDYITVIAGERARKNEDFQTAANSPVPPNRRAEFLPLGYFPVDPDYKTSASLIPAADETILEVPTSTGTLRKMRRLGAMEFTLKGQVLKLAAVIEVGARDVNRLSVLFTDLTSGSETYPGGRYIDLDRTPTGYYEVDFNRAYFPYCYYSPTYECPYPPAENRLKVPVRAGERFKVGTGKSEG